MNNSLTIYVYVLNFVRGLEAFKSQSQCIYFAWHSCIDPFGFTLTVKCYSQSSLLLIPYFFYIMFMFIFSLNFTLHHDGIMASGEIYVCIFNTLQHQFRLSSISFQLYFSRVCSIFTIHQLQNTKQ